MQASANTGKLCERNNYSFLKYFYGWDYSYQVEENLPHALNAVNLQNSTCDDDAMYVDFGATTHMTNNSGNLSNLYVYNGIDKINY